MKRLAAYSSYILPSLWLTCTALSCSSEDSDAVDTSADSAEATEQSALPSDEASSEGAQAAGSETDPISESQTDEGTELSMPEGDNSAQTPDATDTEDLQPALPVTENPDHEALLASADPQLADNKRLVYDMWRTLIEARDVDAAEAYFAEGYIQHNPNADTGRDGVMAFFASLGAALPVEERVQTPLVAIVAERDLVALVQVDEFEQPRPYTSTWFDLFRIEDGVIAEHWDHGRLPEGAAPRAYVPPTEAADQLALLQSDVPTLQANKQLVHEMWRTLLDAQQVEEAPNFLAPGYIQHNPLANTGLAGFLAFFRPFAQPQAVAPNVANFIEMIAEDDLVVLATVRPYDNGLATPYTTTWFDMFRVQDQLLVEHWDTQTIDP